MEVTETVCENCKMTQIVLTSEQASVLATAAEPVSICRPDGSVVAVVPSRPVKTPELTPEEIAEFQRRAKSPVPGYTVDELLRRVKARAEAVA